MTKEVQLEDWVSELIELKSLDFGKLAVTTNGH